MINYFDMLQKIKRKEIRIAVAVIGGLGLISSQALFYILLVIINPLTSKWGIILLIFIYAFFYHRYIQYLKKTL